MKYIAVTCSLLLSAFNAHSGETNSPTVEQLTAATNNMMCHSGYELNVSFYEKLKIIKREVDLGYGHIKEPKIETLSCRKNELDLGAFCVITLCSMQTHESTYQPKTSNELIADYIEKATIIINGSVNGK